MPDNSVNSKRIAKNTMMLYIRQILILLVGLYTVRVVLKTLGIEDYGVYNVVAGAVSMFSFLTGAMATGSQRFFSFYIGKGDTTGLKALFKNTFTIYLLLSFIIVILSETVGIWFINNKLVIPETRLVAANVIFQFSILSFVFSMLNAPFIACLLSHEDMTIYARVGILEVFFKLAVALLLIVLQFDKLICYGLLLLIVSVITTSIYAQYCKKHYEECKIGLAWDKEIIVEVASFSGWNLFGNVAWIIKNQGTSFMLNMFFGPAMNAAQNLATQIRGVVGTFADNFTNAVKPQIVKSYASDDYYGMNKLMYSSSKLAFILMMVIVIPVILNLDFILDIWLDEVPEYASSFTKLMLLEATIEAMSAPSATANQATGKIKYYQMIIGILGIMNLPISYLFLKLEFDVVVVYIVSLILQGCIVVNRMLFLERIEKGSSMALLIKTYIPCLIAGLLSYFICHLLWQSYESVLPVIFTLIYEAIIVLAVCYAVSLNRSERKFVVATITKKIKRV